MPSPLVSADELHARLHAANVRVADVRWYLNRPGAGRAAYDAGHLPGAVFVDLDTDLSDHDGYGAPGRHPLPSPAEFAHRMGSLGFGSDDFIVAYDDAGGTVAARLWWMLDSLGHRGGNAVLDGGIQAWTASGHELTTSQRPPPAAEMRLADHWRNVVAREQVANGAAQLVLLDARAPERYRGEIEPIDPVAGHIPGARNLPTSANLGPDGLLRDAASLEALYAPLMQRGKDTVVSCGSGTTACHDALAMRIAGMRDPLLYVGSFSDWSRSGMPVVSGDEP
ncbi:MAG TPA: sulfurtransferase [Candidatus Limnocylindrales bacterium]